MLIDSHIYLDYIDLFKFSKKKKEIICEEIEAIDDTII